MSGGEFIHRSKPAVVKWLARCRTGCLASRHRLFTHKVIGINSPACPCCGAEDESEEHMVCLCPRTGSSDFSVVFFSAWAQAADALSIRPPPPPSLQWVEQHRLPLVAALIPSSLRSLVALPPSLVSRFLQRLHLELAEQLAERLRRRQALLVMASQSSAAPVPLSRQPRPSALPAERQLAPDVLCRLAVQRQTAATTALLQASSPAAAPEDRSPSSPVAATGVPASGAHRQRWLRDRLVQLLKEDTVPSTAPSPAGVLLALFESTTGEVFMDTPGVKLASRTAGFGRVMGNITRDVEFDPPLVQTSKSAGRCGIDNLVYRWTPLPGDRAFLKLNAMHLRLPGWAASVSTPTPAWPPGCGRTVS